MDLIVQDFEEINIERPQMVAKLLVNLEQGMQKGLINNQSSGVNAFARQMIFRAGLASFCYVIDNKYFWIKIKTNIINSFYGGAKQIY